MFTLHCKPLYAPTDITPPNAYPTLARLRRHTHQPCLIIKSIPWGKSDRADYWHEDTGKSLTSIRKTLSDATRFRTYSFFQTVMDVADVSKHARLELDRRTPAPELTKTNQVVHHRIGALGTFPMATLPMGGTAIVGVNMKLDNGSVFSLSHAIQQVMTIWDKMLESSRNTPLL
ncbi:hypothetical protein C4901_11655 [Acidiferrobacter sp. SPIII_3]|uniref:hypothetical protein n=1 Tax=Acidiferrobacter sp. SPIII_3 TaxID=1281578 RepID=UPI000D727929|nr:hypothetical protein [Acidiferrobacter sp. SPIII_3]AWP23902.1 hypothetical protein C4901_11655 [Acidiferrobacter sp. SPIII_3]